MLFQLKLEILRIGAIPIKSSKGDPITWFNCAGTTETNRIKFLSGGVNRRTLSSSSDSNIERGAKSRARKIVAITLRINENQGLGCIICKGPIENPGIIVQKLKPEGVAIESGLSPGDKLLECNGISLKGMSFQDAVYQLKSSTKLDLIVRKGAAIDFVKEKNKQVSIKINADSSNNDNATTTYNETPKEQQVTILEVEKIKLEQTKIELDKKKIELEHEKLKQKSEELQFEKQQFEDEKRRTLLTLKKSQSHDPSVVPLKVNYSITSEDSDTPSTVSNGGLAGAIQNELLRRKANAKSSSNGNIRDIDREQEMKLKRLTSVTSVLKNDQHDQLIAEFRKVHQRIFNASTTDEDTSSEIGKLGNNGDKMKVTFKDDVSLERSETFNETGVENNRSFSRPNKSPPPPPPVRSSSITPNSSLSSDGSNVSIKSSTTSVSSSVHPVLSTFKPNASILNAALNPSPEIPTPDYDLTPARSANGSQKSMKSEKFVRNHECVTAEIPPIFSSTTSASQNTRPNNKTGSFKGVLINKSVQQFAGSNTPSKLHETNSFKKKNFIKSATPLIRSNFSRRHPPVVDHRAELHSFVIEEPPQKLSQVKDTMRPPPYYFEPERIAPPLVPVTSFEKQPRNISDLHFHKKIDTLKSSNRHSYSHEDLSITAHIDEGLIAAQDYRASHAGKHTKAQDKVSKNLTKAIQQPHQHFTSKASLNLSKASSQSFSDIFQSTKEFDRTLRSNDKKLDSKKGNSSANINVPQKSLKKHPAPPPPPPPPLPSTSYKGIG